MRDEMEVRRAKKEMDEHTKKVTHWGDFVDALDGKNILLAPFCETDACEEAIKKESARCVVCVRL